jgi:hypothetical protein
LYSAVLELLFVVVVVLLATCFRGAMSVRVRVGVRVRMWVGVRVGLGLSLRFVLSLRLVALQCV